MSDYTPTTEQVAVAATQHKRAFFPKQFYQWLAAHDRETAARAWDEAAAGVADPHIARGIRQANPYREGDPT